MFLVLIKKVTYHNIKYSFIPVKTERSTLQSVTQDSDYIHVAIVPTLPCRTVTTYDGHAGQPQPGLARRLPDTDGAKVCRKRVPGGQCSNWKTPSAELRNTCCGYVSPQCILDVFSVRLLAGGFYVVIFACNCHCTV